MILEYKFENSKGAVKTSIVGNFILAVVFLMGGLSNIYMPQVLISLGSGIVLLLIYYLYDWRQSNWNMGIFLIYGMALSWEIINFGIPRTPIEYDGSFSRGMILDFVLMLLPSMYVCMRALMALPMLLVSYRASRLKS